MISKWYSDVWLIDVDRVEDLFLLLHLYQVDTPIFCQDLGTMLSDLMLRSLKSWLKTTLVRAYLFQLIFNVNYQSNGMVTKSST